jgi:hypothetical protein
MSQAVIDVPQFIDPVVTAPAHWWLALAGVEMAQWMDVSPCGVTNWVVD